MQLWLTEAFIKAKLCKPYATRMRYLSHHPTQKSVHMPHSFIYKPIEYLLLLAARPYAGTRICIIRRTKAKFGLLHAWTENAECGERWFKFSARTGVPVAVRGLPGSNQLWRALEFPDLNTQSPLSSYPALLCSELHPTFAGVVDIRLFRNTESVALGQLLVFPRTHELIPIHSRRSIDK